MQIKWLEDFLSVSEAGSFSRAASARNTSQPSLSRHIHALEDWLGVQLIDRRGQGVMLTPAGRLFRNFAADMLRKTYDMRTVLRGQSAVGHDTVRFSVAHTLAFTYFPRWLKELKTSFGPVSARVGAVDIQDGAVALIEGATDLLLIYHHPQLPVLLDPERYPHLVLGMDRILPLCAPDQRGRALYKLPGKPEAVIPLLAYSPGTYLAHVVEMMLLSAGQRCHFERSFETHMAEALKAMVVAGHGMGWLPESCVEREMAERKLVAAGDAQWRSALEIRLYRSAQSSSEVVDKLWAFLLAQP